MIGKKITVGHENNLCSFLYKYLDGKVSKSLVLLNLAIEQNKTFFKKYILILFF